MNLKYLLLFMVEPILLGISAISAISGAFFGKFTKKNQIEENVKNSMDVEFIAIKEKINPKQLLPYLNKPIFLNIEQFDGTIEEGEKFTQDLQDFCIDNGLKLRKVSAELLLLNQDGQKVNIRTLINHENVPRGLVIDSTEISGS